ncbi:hypothetical protein C4553_02065 [Candidatus Parcubacteria bacterium]|nr:MAG: hypothetical protein C4553_02065 [Candidatus Parcubacteria bacterium]
MATKKPINDREARARFVANFFIDLALLLIGGVRRESAHTNGPDITIYSRGAVVEVKGFQHTNFLRVTHQQVDAYLRELNVFSQAWAIVFRYSRPWSKKHNRYVGLFRVARTGEAINQYISQHLLSCHLIDLTVLKALRNTHETSYEVENGRTGRKLESLRLGLHTLENFTNGGHKEQLAKLGLNPTQFRVVKRRVHVHFRDQDLSFLIQGLIQKQSLAARPVPTFFDDIEQPGVLHL